MKPRHLRSTGVRRSGLWGVYRWQGDRYRRLFVGNYTEARRALAAIERRMERRLGITPFLLFRALAPYRISLIRSSPPL